MYSSDPGSLPFTERVSVYRLFTLGTSFKV